MKKMIISSIIVAAITVTGAGASMNNKQDDQIINSHPAVKESADKADPQTDITTPKQETIKTSVEVPAPETPEPEQVDTQCLQDENTLLSEVNSKIAVIDQKISEARASLLARYGEDYYKTHDLNADVKIYVDSRFTTYRQQLVQQRTDIDQQFNC